MKVFLKLLFRNLTLYGGDDGVGCPARIPFGEPGRLQSGEQPLGLGYLV